MAFHLLQHDRDGARRLAAALQQALAAGAPLRALPHLHRDAASAAPARTRTRDARQLCVVETPADQAALERTGSYRGLYFVLMGRLSPLDGVGVARHRRAAAAGARQRRRRRGGHPGHRLHRRRRSHRACAGRGAARARPEGHAAGARRAGRQRAGVRRPGHHRPRAGATGAEPRRQLGVALASPPPWRWAWPQACWPPCA